MDILSKDIFNILIDKDKKLNILKGNFGLEKENVRITEEGQMAVSKHPSVFGPKLEHPYIQTDFAENQVEMITPVCTSPKCAYNYLENINSIVLNNIGDELLWPQSAPPAITKDIPIAEYGDSEREKEARRYREALAEKYGKEKQLISGIHYNYSISDDFLTNIYKCTGSKKSFKDFKTDIYLKVCRNFMQYRWFLIYLLGASPVLHESYVGKDIELDIHEKDYYREEYSVSLRNSNLGYKNDKEFDIKFTSIDNYIGEIERLVKSGDLINEKEYYNPIRLKSIKQSLAGLKEDGVNYVEVRLVDVDPLSNVGISLNSIYTLHLFMMYCLLKEDIVLNNEIASINSERVATQGLDKRLMLIDDNNEEIGIKTFANRIVEKLWLLVDIALKDKDIITGVLEDMEYRFESPDNTIAYEILTGIKEQGYIEYNLNLAKKYKYELVAKSYILSGYEGLELSTQILIKGAIRRGVKTTILDGKENFIKLNKNKHVEYVKQATKTSLDRYVTVLMMENKLVTNKVLSDYGIKVPIGRSYNSLDDAIYDYSHFKDSGIVVKPNTTNHGIGISILKEIYTEKDYAHSIKNAFKFDDTILIEEFIKGKEYRFLVIDDEVVGILHRVPANVVGDGTATIKELVEQKNKDCKRGKGYRTPLEKIELGDEEAFFLRLQRLDFDYVPKKDETIFLRENSNISTGGDSIDYTGMIDESYADVALDCVKKIGAKICGVDMIISDINEPCTDNNYGIIELNFNPAMHMHCYPYKGMRSRIEDRLLDALGF